MFVLIDLLNFFSAIWVMLFNLSIGKFEDLKTFLQRCLSCLGFTEVIHYSLIRVCLLDISIIEIHYGVTVLVSFSPHFICKCYFLFTIQEHPLHLPISSRDFISHSDVGVIFVMVFFGVLYGKFFIISL